MHTAVHTVHQRLIRGRRLAATAVVIATTLLATLLAPPAQAALAPTAPYLDDSGRFSFAERAADLVSRMTLEEKLRQFNAASTRYGGTPAAAIPRLGVREYHYWNEALHGVARVGEATTFPTGLGIGATWNKDLIQQATEVMSDEARAYWNSDRTDIGLTYWSPTINMARDPRWGRADESYGEDPFHTAEIAGAFVDGLQGDDPTYYQAVATAKHYAANNHENDRHSDSSNMSEKTLREFYLPAFQSLAEKHDLGSLMTAYNRVNGVPSVANTELISDLLRRSWGFDGFITSDCWAIDDVWKNHKWIPEGYDRPVNETEATAFSLLAGTDLDCQGGQYSNFLRPALEQGLIVEDDLDISLVRAFTARFRTGEFDSADKNPWPVARYSMANTVATAEHAAVAADVAEEALVLLENATPTGAQKPILPLDASVSKNVVVVGDIADHQYVGDYSPTSPTPDDTILQGVSDTVRGIGGTVTHVGNNDQGTLTQTEEAQIAAASTVIVAVGTKAGDQDSGVGGSANPDSGEFRDRADLTLPRNQSALVQRVAQLNPRVVTYVQSVAQADVSTFAKSVEGLLWSTYNGQTQGTSLARVLWGAEGTSPSGKLTFTWYGDQSQLPGIKDYEIAPHDGTRGRTYQYFTGDVAYPFGYGLTYSSFSYSAPRIASSTLSPQQTLSVDVDVTNTSSVAGSTVPQLYVTTPGADGVTRPNIRLAAFDKVALAPGEKRTVTLSAPLADLWSWDAAKGAEVIDQGTWTAWVGSDVADARSRPVPFTVSGNRVKSLQQVTTIPTGVQLDTAEAHPVIDAGISAVANDQSFYAPGSYTPVYTSSDPAIAQVSPAGKVTPGTKAGTATITVTVTIDGTSKSDTFPVVVERPAPTLTGVTVGGTALEGFDPLRTDYTTTVPNRTAFPSVQAQAATGSTVAVQQATAQKPEATITVTDSSGSVRVYTVRFRVTLATTSFASTSASALSASGWTILNEDTAGWRSTTAGLQIDSASGDLFQASPAAPKNLFLRDAPGDWTATVKATSGGALDQNYQQGFLGVRVDDDNYLKIGLQRDGQTRVNTLVEKNGVAVQTASQEQFSASPTQPVWLRISKSSTSYVTSWSLNGETFQRLRGVTALEGSDAKLMLGAINGMTGAASRTLTFDRLQVSAAPTPAATLTKDVSLPALSGTTLSNGWRAVRPDLTKVAANGTSVAITAQAGEQWQGQPGGAGPEAGTAKNLLVHDAAGDWTSSVKLDLGQAPQTDHEKSVLGVYDDDDNFVLLAYQHDTGRSLEFSVEQDGVRSQRTVTPLPSGGTTQYLRLQKIGSSYTAWSSTDGASWTPASTGPVRLETVRPSLQLAAYGAGTSRTTTFSNLAIAELTDTTALTSTDFRGATRQSLVDTGWSILREDASKIAFGASGTVITSTPTGLWGPLQNASNVLMHRAAGDWTTTVDLSVATPSADYQQAVVGVYDTDGDYLKLTRSYDSGAASIQQLQWAVENNGTPTPLASTPFPANAVALRLIKSGDTFTALYSSDGATFTRLGSPLRKVFTDPKLFLTAYNDSGTAAGLATTFRAVTVDRTAAESFTRFELPQQSFAVERARSGVKLVPDVITSRGGLPTLTYSLQPSGINTAGATITRDGVLTATRPGQVRVTLQGTVGAATAGTAAIITIDAQAQRTLAVSGTSSSRCISGKVVLTTVVKNEDTVPISVTVSNSFGTKTSSGIAPGKSVSQAWTTRQSSITAGTSTAVVSATVDGSSVTRTVLIAHSARSCG